MLPRHARAHAWSRQMRARHACLRQLDCRTRGRCTQGPICGVVLAAARSGTQALRSHPPDVGRTELALVQAPAWEVEPLYCEQGAAASHLVPPGGSGSWLLLPKRPEPRGRRRVWSHHRAAATASVLAGGARAVVGVHTAHDMLWWPLCHPLCHPRCTRASCAIGAGSRCVARGGRL